jgi:hypothetical protein
VIKSRKGETDWDIIRASFRKTEINIKNSDIQAKKCGRYTKITCFSAFFKKQGFILNKFIDIFLHI